MAEVSDKTLAELLANQKEMQAQIRELEERPEVERQKKVVPKYVFPEVMLMRDVYAWIKFLEEKHNARAVEVDGVFKVVPMICETCFYKGSTETKYCPTPSSVGCSKWKHKETK